MNRTTCEHQISDNEKAHLEIAQAIHGIARKHYGKTIVVKHNRTGDLKVVCAKHLPHYTLDSWTAER